MPKSHGVDKPVCEISPELMRKIKGMIVSSLHYDNPIAKTFYLALQPLLITGQISNTLGYPNLGHPP